MGARVDIRRVDKFTKSEIVRVVDDFGAEMLIQQKLAPGDLTMRDLEGNPVHGHREKDGDGRERIVIDTAEPPTDPVLYYTMDEYIAAHEAHIENAVFDMNKLQESVLDVAKRLGHTDMLPASSQPQPMVTAVAAQPVPQLVEDPMSADYKGCCG